MAKRRKQWFLQWEQSHNQSVAAANQERLQKVYRQALDMDEVRARTECFRRAAESKQKAVSGQQNWYFSSQGCKPQP